MATISFTIPTPGPGEDAAVKVVWYQSDDGTAYTQLVEEDINNLTEVDGVYTWEEATADTSKHQLIKTKSTGGVLSRFGSYLAPIQEDPLLQTLTGNVKEFGSSDWSVGDIVTMTIEKHQLANGTILEPVERTVAVNSNGGFVLTPDKGANVTVRVKYSATGKLYFSKSFTVSTEDIADIKDY